MVRVRVRTRAAAAAAAAEEEEAAAAASPPRSMGTIPCESDSVMLDRTGRTYYYVDNDPDHRSLKIIEGTTAVPVRTSCKLSGYFSFTLATPPLVSYLNLHWPKGPKEPSWFPAHPAYSAVVAADKNLLLLRVAIPSKYSCFDIQHDLFVYTGAVPRPSLEHLPLCTNCPQEFFVHESGIGILRLAGDQGHYIVADLIVAKPRGSKNYVAKLCVFFSGANTRNNWKVSTITDLKPSDGGKFPVRWLTSTVLPFAGLFLCWVDYFSGVLLLSGFSRTKDPELRFLPFPGQQYPDEVREGIGRVCPDRFRSLSISQGMMRFVHIDNDFHERMHMDLAGVAKKSAPGKITIWTLKVSGCDFKWEETRKIKLKSLWASFKGPLPKLLPEFPVITMDNPDHVWCLLRENEFSGKAWWIVVDMKNTKLHLFGEYVNGHPYYGKNMELKDTFADVPLLPAVLSKSLNNSTGIPGDGDKMATRFSKRARLSV